MEVCTSYEIMKPFGSWRVLWEHQAPGTSRVYQSLVKAADGSLHGNLAHTFIRKTYHIVL